jgi:hypothetical protein
VSLRRYPPWQGEALHARAVADHLLRELEASTGQPSGPAGRSDMDTDWHRPDTSKHRKPVAGCCTIRRSGSGVYRTDDADRPTPVLRPVTGAGGPPFTTIAWRLWHLTECYGGKRNPEWLGVERPPGGFERDDPAPATAAEAIAVLARAHVLWRDVLQELPAASWWEPLGPVAGPYAKDDKASLVLHQLDEQIHHGAELGVLRDLYLHNRASS